MTKKNLKGIIAILILLSIQAVVFSQSISRPDRGVSPLAPLSSSDFENINLQSGNVNLKIPLAGLPPVAGGKLGFTVNAYYNSKLWDTYIEERHTPPGYMEWYNVSIPRSSGFGGWRVGASYSVEKEYALNDFDFDSGHPGPQPQILQGYHRTYLSTPDGGRHEMRPLGPAPYSGDMTMFFGFVNQSPDTTGQPMTYYSSDGTYIRMVVYPSSSSTQWEVFLSDGTKIEQTSSFQRISDSNGNKIRIFGDSQGTHVQDEYTGREIRINWNSTTGKQEVWYQSVGGTWNKIEIVWGSTTVGGKFYTVSVPEVPYNPACEFHEPFGETLPVVREIIFPQTDSSPLKYIFEYNSDDYAAGSGNYYIPSCYGSWTTYPYASTGLGEINKVITPTGAVHQYEYFMDGETMVNPSNSDWNVASNRITKKKVTHDGITDTWTYSIDAFGSVVTNPNGSKIELNSYSHQANAAGSRGGPNALGGLVYRETRLGQVRVEKRWSSLVFNGASTASDGGSLVFNPVVTHEFTSLLNSSGNPVLMSAKTFQYDFNGNLTEQKEYDWFDPLLVTRDTLGIPTSVPSSATLLRTQTNSFHESPPSSSSTQVYAKTSSTLLNLPKETAIGLSLTRYSYDGLSFGVAPTNGNLTKRSVWDSSSNQWIDNLSSYDSKGNVISSTDANGNVTQYTYGPVNGYTDLYPTQTIAAYGTSVARTSSTTYDFYTGLTTLSTDNDNNLSVVSEYDIFGRPTIVKNAYGTALESWIQTEYHDADRYVVTKADLEAVGDAKKVAIQHYDQLGRVRLSRTLENAATEDPMNEQHGIKVETRYLTTYDSGTSTGYTYQLTSNPFRAATATQATNEPTMGWTLATGWSHGRRSEVETFSGAALPTAFGGGNTNSTGIVRTDIDANATTVTDQAGKVRRSITNGLGQLVRVDEPNGSNVLGDVTTPNQATYYHYNTLGKMVRVQQGDQNRYFMYDSLGRMLRVKQPEQTVNTGLNTSGNPDNNSWTAGFSYDNNGNVLTATDAKGTTITNTYDELNRVEQRSYNDSPQTPTVNFYYDGTGLPSVPNYSKGKLTKVSSSVSESRYTEFDVAGRLLEYKQITDGQTYTSEYEYNLSGALVKETYPSGRVVENSFDSNGDIERIFGKANSSAMERTYANTFSYTADGRIEKLRLGNGLWEAAKFSNRLQVTEFSLGHGVSSGDVWKNNYEYGELQGNGTVDGTKNTGNIGKQTVTFAGLANPFVQTYKYDPLYRLTEAKEINNGNQTWKQVFDYDRYGNRTTYDKWLGTTAQTLTTVEEPVISNTTNRITSSGYTFDANGNLIVDAEGRQFTFNGDNKQTKVKDDQNNTIGEYYFDGEGKRIKKVVGNDTTVFVYSGSKLIAEYSTETPPSSPTTSWTVTDQLGSPRVIVNSLGEVVSRRDFMPFGEELGADETYRKTLDKYGQTDSVRQKFTGYQHDNETGLDFAEARMYQNLNGRFTAIDPLLASGKSANPQTFNRYIYVMNRPLIMTDPTGLQAGANAASVEKKTFQIEGRTFIRETTKEPVFGGIGGGRDVVTTRTVFTGGELNVTKTNSDVNNILSSYASAVYSNEMTVRTAIQATEEASGTGRISSITLNTGIQVTGGGDKPPTASVNAGVSTTYVVTDVSDIRANGNIADTTLTTNAATALSKVSTPTTQSPETPVSLTDTQISGLLTGARQAALSVVTTDIERARKIRKESDAEEEKRKRIQND